MGVMIPNKVARFFYGPRCTIDVLSFWTELMDFNLHQTKWARAFVLVSCVSGYVC